MTYATEVLGLPRVLAITSPDNDASGSLLEKIGFRFEQTVRLSADADEVKLFSSEPRT
jgi:RimJ/RimL family protein N-acetyltransferase